MSAGPIRVDGFAIDTATKITPTFKAKATSQPIEKGSNTSDHLIDEPDGLVIEGIVSDTPSGTMTNIRVNEPGLPTANARAKFLALKRDKRIFTVTTPTAGTYTDMVLLEFTPSYDKDTGQALRFTLVMQVLNLVTNDRQFVKVASPTAASKDNRGNKPGKKPPDTPADGKADRNSSVLWKLTH